MKIIKKYRFMMACILFGMIAGFLYWNFIGCHSGACTITSVWYKSTAYGGCMGGLIGNALAKEDTDEKPHSNEL